MISAEDRVEEGVVHPGCVLGIGDRFTEDQRISWEKRCGKGPACVCLKARSVSCGREAAAVGNGGCEAVLNVREGQV